MKQLFYTSILFLGISMTATAQNDTKIAHSKGKSELVNSKTSGQYTITLPAGTTAESVERNAKYYTIYFTVEYNEAQHEAHIKMVTNDEKSRHVISRFLVASGVEKISVDNEVVDVEQFYVNYLK